MKSILHLAWLIVLIACANKPPFKDEFESDKTWTEQMTQLPAYPDAKHLTEIFRKMHISDRIKLALIMKDIIKSS